ncbi:DNA-binding storekeeper protein-relatedtranscriptional regulator [Striga asiatica]|uniref:DNA-binding storekeeper protein-relatedtranscriptional regulator n=1 Tax=Striga asiatica TaxID=4170 RepID=A0A5A7QIF9_STRAF|nr:DNA-binding storekeeper protein-relatedtranscriptional regulator [Striga asiatica]
MILMSLRGFYFRVTVSAYTLGFDLPRCRWDDGCEAAGDGGAYQRRREAPDFDELYFPVRNLGLAKAGWGRDGRRIAEDVGDYHICAAWPEEQTLGDFRPRHNEGKTEDVQRTKKLTADVPLTDGQMALGATDEGPTLDWQRCSDGIREMEITRTVYYSFTKR